MKTLLGDFGPIVSQLSKMLGHVYGTVPQASVLNLISLVSLDLIIFPSWFQIFHRCPWDTVLGVPMYYHPKV